MAALCRALPCAASVLYNSDGTTTSFSASDDSMNDSHVYQSPGDDLISAVATNSDDATAPAYLNNVVAPSSEWSTTGISNSLTSLAVQPDGSIDAIQSGAGSLRASLVHFTSGGQSDGTTFDDVTVSISSISTVAVQPVAGGFDVLAAGSGYSVARFDSGGSLDTTFGNAGIATPTSPLPSGEGEGEGGIGGVSENPQMVVEPDGALVLAGLEPGSGSNDDLVLVKYLADGQPDTSFDSTGIASDVPPEQNQGLPAGEWSLVAGSVHHYPETTADFVPALGDFPIWAKPYVTSSLSIEGE
jgi:hypothetical protein